ncbi:hypothetical protein EDB89DRAFT_1910321 [Lactarius sanguifluus]|nr:hypothetical protein EDB89DRAFT_1910321 [Lactarius sanguifluus]
MYRDDVTAATTIPPIATSSNSNQRLCEIHVEKFEHKHGVVIREDPKAMMKSWKEADRLNAILSANAEASARVFESACMDMKVAYLAEHKSVDPPGVHPHTITSMAFAEGLVNVSIKFSLIKMETEEAAVLAAVAAQEEQWNMVAKHSHLNGWFRLKPNNGEGPIHRFISEPQNRTEPTGVGPTRLPESQKTGPHGLNRLIQAVASSTSRRGRRASGCRCVDVAAVVTVVAVVARRSHRRRRRLVDVAAKVAAVEVSPSVSPFKLPKCRRRSVIVLVVAVVANVLWVQLWSVIVDAMLMIVVVGDGAVVVFEAVVEAVGVVGWSWLIVAVKTGWDQSQPALWRFTHLPDLDEPQPVKFSGRMNRNRRSKSQGVATGITLPVAIGASIGEAHGDTV